MKIRERIKNIVCALKLDESLEKIIEEKNIYELLFNEIKKSRRNEFNSLEEILGILKKPSKFIYTDQKYLKHICSYLLNGNTLYKILLSFQQGLAEQEYIIRRKYENVFYKKLNRMKENSFTLKTIDKNLRSEAEQFKKKFLTKSIDEEEVELKLLKPFLFFLGNPVKTRTIGFIDTSYIIKNYNNHKEMKKPLKENDISIGIFEVYQELSEYKESTGDSKKYKENLYLALWKNTNALTLPLKLEEEFKKNLEHVFGGQGQRADYAFMFYKKIFYNTGIKTRIYTEDFKLNSRFNKFF